MVMDRRCWREATGSVEGENKVDENKGLEEAAQSYQKSCHFIAMVGIVLFVRPAIQHHNHQTPDLITPRC